MDDLFEISACAPIIIPTLCRYEQFKKSIDSLKKNRYANMTDVFIGLDFPIKEEHKEGNALIKQYIYNEDFSAFHSFNVIERTENYGVKRNIIDLKKIVMKNYDSFIYADDDIEYSEDFIEYMNLCLSKYKDDDEIIAITGYSYPIKWKVDNGSNVFRQNFICPMWGTGMWTKKAKEVDGYIESGNLNEYFEKNRQKALKKTMTDACKMDYVWFNVKHDHSVNLAKESSDVAYRIYMAIKNKYVISPVLSHTRNMGFDGSGVYCNNNIGLNGKNARTYCYAKQEVSHGEISEIIESQRKNEKTNLRKMNRFDKRKIKEKMYSKLILLKYCIDKKREKKV